jgi:hypothetical protein
MHCKWLGKVYSINSFFLYMAGIYMHACNYYLLNDVHALVYNFIHMH